MYSVRNAEKSNLYNDWFDDYNDDGSVIGYHVSPTQRWYDEFGPDVTDSDGDGVVDSQDADPYDPNVQ